MTYRQKSYGSLLLILTIFMVIGFVSDIPGTLVVPLITLLVINLLFVEVGRYFIMGKPSSGKKAWSYRQKHYAESIFGIGLNAVVFYFLPFPSLVWIVLPTIFIMNTVTIEIKHALIHEP